MRKQEEANNRALDEMQVVSEIETRKIAEQKEADEETKLLNMAILRSPFAETSIVLRANESSSPRTAAKSSSDSAASTTLRSLLEVGIIVCVLMACCHRSGHSCSHVTGGD